MTPLFAILAIGFVLGLRHATDSDHLVAVTTIVTREKSARAAALVGALWGLGHTVTIILVGGAMVAFRITLPPRICLGLELAVAGMLVVLGIGNLVGLRARPHADTEASTFRAHDHTAAWAYLRLDKGALRPLGVGIVHGLAGSAAIALLVVETVSDPRWALAYLGVFGVGTILGMAMLTTLISLPIALTARRFSSMGSTAVRMAGVLSVVFGGVLAYRIGFVDGLFAGSLPALPH